MRRLALLFRLIITFILLVGCQLSNPATPPVIPTLFVLPTQTVQPTATQTPVPPTATPTPTLIPSPTATPYPRVNVEAVYNFKSRYLGDERTLLVYLPGNYASRPADRRYKVLYANDGQDMPQIALDQVLTRLYAQHKMEEIIVVAVTTDDRRLQQYGTGRDTGEFGWGGSAYYYMEFLAREVVPYIDSHFATQTGAKNTALMGWSLGGLSAFCTAFKYPNLFGTVGVFSGSLWWRTASNTPQDMLNTRVAFQIVRETRPLPALRFWFEAGTQDDPNDRDKNGIIDSVQDTMDMTDLLAQKGYKIGTDLIYRQVDGGRHELGTWILVLPEFLAWAFPPIP